MEVNRHVACVAFGPADVEGLVCTRCGGSRRYVAPPLSQRDVDDDDVQDDCDAEKRGRAATLAIEAWVHGMRRKL